MNVFVFNQDFFCIFFLNVYINELFFMYNMNSQQIWETTVAILWLLRMEKNIQQSFNSSLK